MTRKTLNEIIQALLALREGATDDQAYKSMALYPEWRTSFEYAAGDRVKYAGKLYKVLQAHTSIDAWTPSDAPSLFAEVLPGQDGTDVDDWVQPDSTNSYMTGDRVRWTDGHIYESTIDNNIWSPGDYPAGWKIVG